MISREPIYAALFERVAGAAHFVTTGRKLRHWSDLTARGATGAFHAAETAKSRPSPVLGAPTVWTLGRRALRLCPCERPLRRAGDGAQPADRRGRSGAGAGRR